MGPIDTCNSGPKVDVLHGGLAPIETSDSDANQGIWHAQNDR